MKLSTLVIAIAMISGQAAAEGISTGKKGLSYYQYGTNISAILAEQQIKQSVMSSKGSIENLNRVAAGEADFGFTQADALMFWRSKNSQLQNKIEVLGALGKECAFMAVREDGPIDSEDDLGKKGIKLAVGDSTSGSAASWNYMTQLEESYREASIFYKSGVRALAGVSSKQYDGFMWVTSESNMNNKYLQTVQQENSGLKLISLNDYDMNDKLPSGEVVYEFRKVPVKEGWFSDHKIEAPCTDILVVGNVDAPEEALEAVAGALLLNKNRVLELKK